MKLVNAVVVVDDDEIVNQIHMININDQNDDDLKLLQQKFQSLKMNFESNRKNSFYITDNNDDDNNHGHNNNDDDDNEKIMIKKLQQQQRRRRRLRQQRKRKRNKFRIRKHKQHLRKCSFGKQNGQQKQHNHHHQSIRRLYYRQK